MKKKIAVLVFLLLGFCALMYPVLGNIITVVNQNSVIDSYNQELQRVDDSRKEELKKQAQEYNNKIQQSDNVSDPFDEKATESSTDSNGDNSDGYYSALDIGQEAMAYIEIPKISVNLPIYHGTSDLVLQKGVGHLKGTALPIGGASTHCVLTGHTGLPTAELFTHLDQLVKGDMFYIKTLGDTLAYKVTNVAVVEPNDIDLLEVQKGKDLVTLITCTPYGVNSHRLLVTGERTDYNENDSSISEENKLKDDSSLSGQSFSVFGLMVPFWILYIIVPLILLVVIGLIVWFIIKKKKKEKENHEADTENIDAQNKDTEKDLENTDNENNDTGGDIDTNNKDDTEDKD